MHTEYDKNNPETIRTLFDSIAPRYDLVNSILSLRLHTLWNQKLTRKMFSIRKPEAFLDLCAGTGEIALRAVRHALKTKKLLPHFDLVDFSKEMLVVAQNSVQQLPEQARKKFSFTVADVTALPFENHRFDVATCAYGIRNVKDPAICLAEAYRTLKPGGMLAILELTRPQYRLFKQLHSVYLRLMLPLVGKWLTKNSEAYEYLEESIHAFISPDVLVQIANKVGFEQVTREPLAGGIATLFCMHKY